MDNKRFAGANRISPYCSNEIENPNINYCPTCNNVLWSQALIKGGIRRIK